MSCKYHLAIDVTEHGTIVENFPGRDLEELPHTCALDVVDAHGALADEAVGALMNLTREGVRQTEQRALEGIRRTSARRLRVYVEESPAKTVQREEAPPHGGRAHEAKKTGCQMPKRGR